MFALFSGSLLCSMSNAFFAHIIFRRQHRVYWLDINSSNFNQIHHVVVYVAFANTEYTEGKCSAARGNYYHEIGNAFMFRYNFEIHHILSKASHARHSQLRRYAIYFFSKRNFEFLGTCRLEATEKTTATIPRITIFTFHKTGARTHTNIGTTFIVHGFSYLNRLRYERRTVGEHKPVRHFFFRVWYVFK